MEVEMGDTILEVPDEATPEQLKAIISKVRQTPVFDQTIDKKTGAPARVRTLVGSAPEPDRLPNLKRYYPDAQPYGDDNFVFTDPGTGRPTLYNPSGLDTGDIFAVAREITQFTGATLGAAGGAIVGAAAGSPTGPGALLTGGTGAVMGAGLGNAVGGALFDTVANVFMDRVDTRTPGRVVLDSALDIGVGAAGEGAGNLVGAGVKAAVAGGRRQVRQLVDAFTRLGIEPPAAAVSGSRATQTLAKSLESSPFSADIMQKQAETVLEQTQRATETLAARFGEAKTKQGAGAVIREAAVNAAERFKFEQERLYTEAFDLIGADTPVVLNSITALRKEMESQLAQAPQSLGKSLKPAIDKLKALEIDAAQGGGVPFGALREVRTAVGRDLDAPMLAGATSAQNVNMKRVYGALTEDLSVAARSVPPDPTKMVTPAWKLAAADEYTKKFMQDSAKLLQKIERFDADERAFEFTMSAAKDGGTALGRLRRNFLPEEWDTVAATVLNRLGQARPGAQDAAGEAFSVSTFLTNWNRLAPEAKEALFGGSRYAHLRPALDDLTKVVESLKDVEKLTNTSNTARAMFTLTLLGALGGGAGAAATGDMSGAGAGVASTLAIGLSTRTAAKLLTSPKFVQWLARPPETGLRSIPAHIGRLEAIAHAEPEIAEEIDQYLSALRGVSAPPADIQGSAGDDDLSGGAAGDQLSGGTSVMDGLRDSLKKKNGVTYGEIFPVARDDKTGELSLSMPNFAREWGGAILDLLEGTKTGEVKPGAAIIALPVPGLIVGRMAPVGAIGMFGGKMAKTADLDALKNAETMAAKNVDRTEIWEKTGWFKGPDGEWRFEIDDSQSSLTDKAMGVSLFPDRPDLEGTLSDALRHPGIDDAYGLTNEVRVGNRPGVGGSHNLDTGRITADGSNPGDIRSTLLHETQHAIQGREGFSPGGSPGEFSAAPTRDAHESWSRLKGALRSETATKLRQANGDFKAIMAIRKADPEGYAAVNAALGELRVGNLDQADDALVEFGRRINEMQSPMDAYRRLAGEAEARNVQTRMNMTPEERKKTPPWETLDVPEGKQIIRKGKKPGKWDPA